MHFKRFGIVLSTALICTFAACMDGSRSASAALPQQTSTTNAAGTAFFYFKMPEVTNRDRYLSVSASRSANNGATPGFPVRIDIAVRQRGSVGRSVERLAPLDLDLAERVADDDERGEIPESEMLRFGKQLARQSVCPNGALSTNTVGRRLSDPAAISEFLAANGGRVLGGRLPDGMQTEPIPPVSLDRFGWEINLWCT
ncbi:MAG: hypothetical protein AAFP85_06310 [Pseudomonadota bacterium]